MDQKQQLIQCGQDALLQGEFEKAMWALDAALYLSPGHRDGKLWQRGLACFYSGRYQDGVKQFEMDMGENGSDVEEVLWHFLCRCKLFGFRKAQEDGFLSLRKDVASDESVPPMPQILKLYQGQGNIDDIFSAATLPDGSPAKSYNDTSALPYAHFYVGLYHEMRGELEQAEIHLKIAAASKNPDYIGKLMQIHYNLFHSTTFQKTIVPSFALNQTSPLRNPTVCSSIIQGGWQLSSGHLVKGKKVLQSEIVAGLLEAYDAGIRSFDCGDIYTGVEEIYGLFIKAHCKRGGRAEDILIHTKLVPDLDVIRAGKVDREYIRSVVNRSLNRLGVRTLPLVQFYWWDNSCSGYLDAVRVLNELLEEGAIANIGLTNFDTEQTSEILSLGIPIASTQVQYSLLDRRPLHSGLVSRCEQHNIKILCYGVLAGGFLTDKWLGAERPAVEDLSNRSLVKYLLIIDEFGGWSLFQELLHTLRTIADSHTPLSRLNDVIDVSIAMVAIRYILNQKQVGGVIVGAHNDKYTQSTISAAALNLTEEDTVAIEAVLAKAKGPGGPVFGFERQREGKHGRIMKYNLNQVNQGAHLEELCHRYLCLHFEAYPVEATRAGYRVPPLKDYQSFCNDFCSGKLLSNSDFTNYSLVSTKACSYDHSLDIASENDIKSFCSKVKSLLREVEGIDCSSLSPEQLVDLQIMASQLKVELVKWEEIQVYKKDPGFYLPLNAILYLLPVWGSENKAGESRPQPMSKQLEDCAHPGVVDMSPRERLVALLSRLRALPNVLLSAHENLTKPIRMFVETAIEICTSFRPFLSNTLPDLCKSMISDEDSAILAEIQHASTVASQCIEKFEAYLKNDILPRSTEVIGVGKEAYEKLLKYNHFIDSSDELLKLGEEHFTKIKEDLDKLAAEIDPTRTWKEITKEVISLKHPTASNLLSAFMEEIERARRHMQKESLVSDLPPGEKVLGFSTPKFLIPFSPFGDFLNPSPFAGMGSDNEDGYTQSQRIGHLMLHSIKDRNLPQDKETELLRGMDHTFITVIAPHETYPGHHVQALLAQQHPRVLRKYHESTLFYEGWGLYTEELAYETGFFAKEQSYIGEESNTLKVIPAAEYSKLTRLTQLRLRLWRAARIILDVKLNTGQLSFEECRKFLEEEVQFNETASKGEVFMYASRPGYAPCYVAGFVMLMKLREKMKERCRERGEEFSLRDFHDIVLSKGCIPFKLLEPLLCYFSS